MNKINCEVIEDLLPLYVEHMASSSTNALVEDHLSGCESCRKKADSMHTQVSLPMDTDVTLLAKVRRQMFQKKVTVAGITLLMFLLVTVLFWIQLNSPILIPYEDVADSIQITQDEGDRASIQMNSMGGSSETIYTYNESGELVETIRLYTTPWKQLTKMTAGTFYHEWETTGEKAVKEIYYFPHAESGSSILLYSVNPASTDANSVLLPRLTLNYYTIIAATLTIVGIIVCVLLRQKRSRLFVALKITLLPAAYLICSLVVLLNQGGIYNMSYYFSGILIGTILLYAAGYWFIEYFRHRIQRNS